MSKHSYSTSPVFLVLLLAVGFIGGMLGSIFVPKIFPSSEKMVPFSDSSTQSVFLGAKEEENQTIHVVEKSNPAVVSVVISKNIPSGRLNGDIFLEDLYELGLPFDFRAPTESEEDSSVKENLRRVGGGSGFIIRKDGYIVTNKHVVSDKSAVYTVILSDARELEAEVLGVDPIFDMAILKIEADNLPVLPLGDSDELRIGQTVIAIGNALAEFGNSVTKGVVSGIERRVRAGDGFGRSEILEEAIQTDAAINPGNSGGPLLNLAGEVVGINTAVSQSGQLVGFAIPINSVKQILEGVVKEGRIIRPWVGIRYIPVTPRLADQNNLPVTYGVLVVPEANNEEDSVIPGGPAEKAGIEPNDIILELNGKKLDDKDSFSKEISKYSVGDRITLRVLHEGTEREVSLTLEEFPLE